MAYYGGNFMLWFILILLVFIIATAFDLAHNVKKDPKPIVEVKPNPHVWGLREYLVAGAFWFICIGALCLGILVIEVL